MSAKKRSRYKRSLMDYGFITLCYLIWQYEQEEDYEECAMIKSIIDEANTEFNMNMPTRLGKKAVDYWKNEWKQKTGKSAELDEDTIQRFARDVKTYVNG